MTTVVAEGVLELLRRDRSNRAAHYACLKAAPFCKESESLQHGVRRLDAWLTLSVELDHGFLNKVVVVVLACFLLKSSGRVKSVADLNDTWLDITRSVVSPCATTVHESYLRDARMAALFTLYKYMPEKYGVALMSVEKTNVTCVTRHILDELQGVELAEQARRNVVGKLVACAIRNVIKGVKEHARVQRLRWKKERRRLTKSIDPLPLDDAGPGGENEGRPMTEDAPPHASLLAATAIATPVDTSSVVDECIVCLDPIGSKRPLFTCGHARCCSLCAPIVHECPMCRQPVRILMDIFV